MATASAKPNGWVAKAALGVTVALALIGFVTAFSRLEVHADSRGHQRTVDDLQRHGEDIRGLDRDVEHIGERVDEIRTEQKAGFERLDDKLEQIRRQR